MERQKALGRKREFGDRQACKKNLCEELEAWPKRKARTDGFPPDILHFVVQRCEAVFVR